MHVVSETKSIAAERTPEACDFADRLRLAAKEVHVIELAVEGAGIDKDSLEAIVLACRKVRADLELMCDEVLPPMSEAEKAIIRDALKGSKMMLDASQKNVRSLVFDMEGNINAAVAWAWLVNDGLSQARALGDEIEADAYSRVAGELLSSVNATHESFQELFNLVRNEVQS